MFQQARNTGKSVPVSEMIKQARGSLVGEIPHPRTLTDEEMKKMAAYPESDFFGEPKDQSPDPVQHEVDTLNDGGYNEKTGFKNPPGREKNYLRMRSRIGRRR